MKIADILGGTKKRKKRGSRLDRIKGKGLISKKKKRLKKSKLGEVAAGVNAKNMFPDSVSFEHEKIPQLMKVVNSVMAKTGAPLIPIGSGATPTPGEVSGDLDMIVDVDKLRQHFNMEDAQDADIRKKIRQLFDLSGFNTGQSGTSVHIEVPIGNQKHQVDIMVVPNAANAAKFHTHSIPAGSKWKGANKQIALAYLAKKQNMLWSPYQGLFRRLENGKKDPNGLVTDNIDEVARQLLGPNATGKDIGSVEQIMAALGTEAGNAMLADLRADPNWKERE